MYSPKLRGERAVGSCPRIMYQATSSTCPGEWFHVHSKYTYNQSIYTDTYTYKHRHTQHTHIMWCVCIYFLTQPLSLSLPDLRSGVTLDHRLTETEGYYSLLQDQVQDMNKSLNSSEEAKQLQETSKAMLEALRQCIDIMKDSQLTDQVCE